MEPLPSRRADLDTPDTRELRKLIEEVGHKLKDPRRQAPRSSCSWGSPEVDGKWEFFFPDFSYFCSINYHGTSQNLSYLSTFFPIYQWPLVHMLNSPEAISCWGLKPVSTDGEFFGMRLEGSPLEKAVRSSYVFGSLRVWAVKNHDSSWFYTKVGPLQL
jgi:hypothetical protein